MWDAKAACGFAPDGKCLSERRLGNGGSGVCGRDCRDLRHMIRQVTRTTTFCRSFQLLVKPDDGGLRTGHSWFRRGVGWRPKRRCARRFPCHVQKSPRRALRGSGDEHFLDSPGQLTQFSAIAERDTGIATRERLTETAPGRDDHFGLDSRVSRSPPHGAGEHSASQGNNKSQKLCVLSTDPSIATGEFTLYSW
jgi:hypothetical protein